MKREYSIFLILGFLFIGCRSEYIDSFTLKPDNKQIKIPIGKSSRNISKCIQYFTINKENYLAVANNVSNSIEIYNLDTQTLQDEVIIKTEGVNSFSRNFGFIVKNHDTIIAVCQNPQLIGIINWKGEILKKISYSTDINGSRIQMTTPYSFGAQGPYLVNNFLWLGQFYRADNSKGVFTPELQENSHLAVKVDLKTGECRKMPLVYPDEIIGHNIIGMYVRRVIGYNNNMVYTFSNVPGLYLSGDNTIFKKRILETNYKLNLADRDNKNIPDAQSGMNFSINHDEIVDMLYDKYRECYYIFIRTKSKYSANELNVKFLYPDCLIVVLDKNLKHMGEMKLDDNIYSVKMKFITEKGLFISEDHIKNPLFDENWMRFRLFVLGKK